MTSLIVHHSVMAEMLPCTLSLSRYNATFRLNEEGNNSDGNDGSDDDGDYLDPSKDSDYELISKLRYGMLNGRNVSEEEDNYSELEDLGHNENTNNKSLGLSLKNKFGSHNKTSLGSNKTTHDKSTRCASSVTGYQTEYR